MNVKVARYYGSKAVRLVFQLLLGGWALLLFPIFTVHADIVPFYTMDFTFEYRTDPVSITQGYLFECLDSTCSQNQLRNYQESIGPERFWCTASRCASNSYVDPPYYKLVIEFSDRTRESNIFTSQRPSSHFEVSVLESHMVVREVFSHDESLHGFLNSLLFTVVLETLVAGIYSGIFGLPVKTLVWIPLANILTLPVIWIVFSQLVFSADWVVVLAEGVAALFESGFIYWVTNKKISFAHSVVLSTLMNAASFSGGLFLWRMSLIPF